MGEAVAAAASVARRRAAVRKDCISHGTPIFHGSVTQRRRETSGENCEELPRDGVQACKQAGFERLSMAETEVPQHARAYQRGALRPVLRCSIRPVRHERCFVFVLAPWFGETQIPVCTGTGVVCCCLGRVTFRHNGASTVISNKSPARRAALCRSFDEKRRLHYLQREDNSARHCRARSALAHAP